MVKIDVDFPLTLQDPEVLFFLNFITFKQMNTFLNSELWSVV